MSTLTERLHEVMKAMNWSQADLRIAAGVSSSVVSQWLGKGNKEIKTIGKLEAAERLEKDTGFAALWIAKGIGPKHVQATVGDHFRPAAHSTREAAPAPYLAGTSYVPSIVLKDLRNLLRAVRPELRPAFADILAAWAREGGSEDRAEALLLMIGEQPAKRRGTA